MIERLLAGDRALEEGRWADAEKAFRQVAEADPRSAIARVGLARVAIARGRVDEARPLLAEALALDPDDAVARRLLAEPGGPVPPAPGRGLLDRLLRRGR